MNQAIRFNSIDEATKVLAPLFKSGRIATWSSRKVFGQVVARYREAGSSAWFDFTGFDAARFEVAA